MSEGPDPNDILGNFLKSNKSDHYNFEDECDYKVSSGSLQFDLCMNGGFGPGLHRFTGLTEGGKTSEALEVMKNFLNTKEQPRGLYIKAEGRLGKEVRERSGVKFVWSADEWVDGTCFVLETNIYETAMTCIKQLIDNEKNKHKYCFILDSVDGLVAKNDASKGFDEFAKIAAGASIASTWCKQTSIALGKRGHMAIFISQVRSEMRDQYSKEPPRQSVATGGYALQHYANSVIQFQPRYKSDLILQNPSIKTIDEKKNPIIGHFAKVLICKSPNEKSNISLSYPVRYNRSGGNSIWIEKEIVDLLYAWEFVEKKGAWIKPTEDFCELLTENKLNFPEQIQGDNNLFKTLDQDEELCKFLIKYFGEQIAA